MIHRWFVIVADRALEGRMAHSVQLIQGLWRLLPNIVAQPQSRDERWVLVFFGKVLGSMGTIIENYGNNQQGKYKFI